ncbi:uncharacterized protein BJ171DRAFT_492796 [Polychytrium aggregatum]|uniref:uncharacterized protein n=1 Tax=Polychytrium aggregatum TaxID=110093 RepID=UPI0022FE5A24|nr:uncharacterized protein BJ171DRAFT_492796 [Polychytrium aggregatum]KAI9207456.1 hypothetical protein BJ171DRAFT_492796 [Polychytrium aggregatum]
MSDQCLCRLCGQCPEGQYEWGRQCVRCDDAARNIAVGIAAFIALFLVVCILLDFDHTTVVSKALSFLSLSLNIENSQGGCVLPLSPFDKMIAPYVVALGMIVCQGLWHAMIQFVRGPDRGPLFKKIWAKTIHWFPYLDTGLRHSLKRTSIILIFFYFSPVYSTGEAHPSQDGFVVHARECSH